VVKNFRFRIKDNTDDLADMMETARRIWNYVLMLHRKSYEWTGKNIPLSKLQSYILRKRGSNQHWQRLNAQSVQEICERIEVSYRRFFKGLQIHPPQFKGRGMDTSFCFKQHGYKIHNDRIVITDPKNRKKPIGTYRFLKHRAYPTDKVRTVRIKKYNNRFYVTFCCDCSPEQLARDCNGTVGIDFGLKTFITMDDGNKIESPIPTSRTNADDKRDAAMPCHALSRNNRHSIPPPQSPRLPAPSPGIGDRLHRRKISDFHHDPKQP